MSKIRLHGSSSGYTEIAPVAASGNNTVTLPNDGTIISKDANGAVGVTSITVGTGVTIGDGKITCDGSALTSINAAQLVGVCTAGLTRTGGFGGGKILQIVQAEHTTAAQSTSGTYADTGLTASITTSSSGHAGVFVIANLAMGAQAANGGDAYVIFNIVRGSTQVKQGMVGQWASNLSGHTHVGYWQPEMNFYDTGTSASTSYTYKCQYAKKSDATAAFYNNTNQYGSSLILLEIGS